MLRVQVLQVQGAPHGALNFQGTREGEPTPAFNRARVTRHPGKAIVRQAALFVRRILKQSSSRQSQRLQVRSCLAV